MMKILLVEDDRRIIEFVKRGLEAEGYNIDVAENGEDALKIAASPTYSLIILDRMLPDIEGAEICQRLRIDGNHVPVLMLTAMDAIEEKVKGLRMGADDYLTKPFAFEELLARIEALLRRNQSFEEKETELVLGDLRMNFETKEVFRGDQVISLTPKEFSLLAYLMSNTGKVVSRTKILENVWGYNTDPLTNVVEVCIRGLRRKVDEEFPEQLIQTVRGFGYKICAE
ncbi:response regulator transcription factor [Pseudomonadota bacterium]